MPREITHSFAYQVLEYFVLARNRFGHPACKANYA